MWPVNNLLHLFKAALTCAHGCGSQSTLKSAIPATLCTCRLAPSLPSMCAHLLLAGAGTSNKNGVEASSPWWFILLPETCSAAGQVRGRVAEGGQGHQHNHHTPRPTGIRQHNQAAEGLTATKAKRYSYLLGDTEHSTSRISTMPLQAAR